MKDQFNPTSEEVTASFIEEKELSYNVGTAVRSLSGDKISVLDLNTAIFYLNREIELLES